MVLSTLAAVIYNFYLLVYYVLKTCAFVGYVLFDIVHHVSWLIKKAYDFFTLVYEDNRYFIQDVKSVVGGTADFFVNNIASVYSTIRSISEKCSKTIAALQNLPNVIIETAKQELVQIGKAVWFVFTLPMQLAVLLVDLATQFKDSANAVLRQSLESTIALVHYITHDVPLEAACGLGLLVLAYFCPTGRNITYRFIVSAASYLYHRLGQMVQKFLRMVNEFKNKMYTFIRASLQYDVRSEVRNQLPVTLILLCIGIHAHAADFYDTRVRPMLTSIYNMFLIRTNDQPRIEVPAAVRPRRRETPNPTTIGLCIICEDNERSVAFVPCGHICACKVCSIHLCYHNPVCPLCRSYIQQKLEIYL